VAAQSGTLARRAAPAPHDQYASQIEELSAETADYERLCGSRVAVLELSSLLELPEALIRARTAARLSQEALAARLDLKQQQIQRYEATRYAGVSLQRIQAVADALGVTIREQVTLPTVSGAHELDDAEPTSA